MDEAQLIGIALGFGTLGVLLLIIFIKANIVMCQPNELVIIAGRQRRFKDGATRGYRVIRGGRGFKLPMVESVARLPLTAMPVAIHVSKAMCKGMIPVNLEGRANVKLAGHVEDGMDQAIERFLGRGSDAVAGAAKQTLEGALRGVIAQVAPEEANRNRLELAEQVTDSAREQLAELGIVLDFFQIHELNDEQGYLDAIGRKRAAEVQRDALVAEATADAEAREVAAKQKQIGREAEIAAELSIVENENALAVKRSTLKAKENDVSERATVAGEIARIEEQTKVETKRAELSEQREQADTVVPAKAARVAKLMAAEGDAARIMENGRATAKAVELMREQWQDEKTRDLFLIQLMPELLDKVTSVVSDNLRVDKLTILDGGSGEGLPNYVKNLTNSAVSMLEQVKNATGVDLAQLAEKNGSSGATLPKELD
jgi:flotillin